MQVSVHVNSNFYEEVPMDESDLLEKFGLKKQVDLKAIKKLFRPVYELRYNETSMDCVRLFSFRNAKKKWISDNGLILKIYSKESETKEQYFIQTGLFAGVVYHNGCRFNIGIPYGNIFLRRMLNAVNEIYIDDQKQPAQRHTKENPFLFILIYLFVHTLEKAAVLGLPKEYSLIRERDTKFRGTLDLQAYITRDIPFTGLLSTKSRQQRYCSDITDILYLALKKAERLGYTDSSRILPGIYRELKHNYSGRIYSRDLMRRAKSHNSLVNPVYAGFKRVLTYAEIILSESDLMPDVPDAKSETKGFLFDVSELFELYLEKLMKRNFQSWNITSQDELTIYENTFFRGTMYPDFVLRNRLDGSVAVFDAKFKRMGLTKTDLDRSDLYQIHTYMNYFQGSVVAGGLIYPLSKEQNTGSSHSASLFGKAGDHIRFVADGIFITGDMSMQDIKKSEDEFIARMQNLLQTNS